MARLLRTSKRFEQRLEKLSSLRQQIGKVNPAVHEFPELRPVVREETLLEPFESLQTFLSQIVNDSLETDLIASLKEKGRQLNLRATNPQKTVLLAFFFDLLIQLQERVEQRIHCR